LTKVVLDTNIIISGVGWGGLPRKVINLWEKGKITLCISAEVFNEYLELLQRRIKPGKDYQWFVRLIDQRKNIEIVKPEEHFAVIKEDPDDNIFLDCAIAGKVEYIISGDEHLLNLKKFKGIKILTPGEFLREIS